MLSEAALALEVRINDDSGSVMDSVKLIASDMDGTLLNGKGELDPAFFPLFRELELRGIRFAAASGRQYDGLLRTFAPWRTGCCLLPRMALMRRRVEKNGCFWTWIMKR